MPPCGVCTLQTCRTYGIVQLSKGQRPRDQGADGLTRRPEKQGDTIAAAAFPSQTRSSDVQRHENMVSLAQEDNFPSSAAFYAATHC